MKREDSFVMTEDELFKEVPKVCIMSECLLVEEHKNMFNYLKELQKDGKIKPLGYRNLKGGKEQQFSIGFTLHECLLRYPRWEEKDADKQLEIGNKCEFIRILPTDAVFVFVGSENPLPYKGRLWNRIETLGKPVIYFMRNEDNTSWLPYKACQFVFNKATEKVEEDWCFIGEIEPYEPSEDEFKEMEESKNDNRFYRAFSQDVMNEREYNIALRCLKINSACMGLEVEGRVKRDDSLIEKAQKLLKDQTEIFIALQRTEIITEDMYKLWETKLDFMEADLEE